MRIRVLIPGCEIKTMAHTFGIYTKIIRPVGATVEQSGDDTCDRNRIVERPHRIKSDIKPIALKPAAHIIGKARSEQHDGVIMSYRRRALAYFYFCPEFHLSIHLIVDRQHLKLSAPVNLIGNLLILGRQTFNKFLIENLSLGKLRVFAGKFLCDCLRP